MRENRLVFWEEIRHERRYVAISGVQPGSSLSAAAQRERRVGGRPSEYVLAPRGGAVGPAGVGTGLQRRRRRVICAGADVEGVAVRLSSALVNKVVFKRFMRQSRSGIGRCH